MNKIISGILFLLVIFSFSVYCFDNGDFQYWNSEGGSLKLSNIWKINIEEEFRFGDDANDFYYQHSDLGLIYSNPNGDIDIGINYRHIYEKKDNSWEIENRPHLNLSLKYKLLDYNFSNRSRLEYRNRKNLDNYWRYRNKTAVQLPVKFTKLEIQPYLADEIFIDFDQKKINRNRLYLGLTFNIVKNLKGEVYYLWQINQKNGRWLNVNVLGTKIKIPF